MAITAVVAAEKTEEAVEITVLKVPPTPVVRYLPTFSH